MDVLELDAARRTKVDEMRELLDGVRYAPVAARYKDATAGQNQCSRY